MVAIRQAVLATAIGLGLFVQPAVAVCPPAFAAYPPDNVAEGGMFFIPRDAPYARLQATTIADFKGSALKLFFVPRTNLCGEAGGAAKRPDCGDRGFLLVKTVKDTGAFADGKVHLQHGSDLAVQTGFTAFSVDFEDYQRFHEAEDAPIDEIRDRWHQTFEVGGRQLSTFEPGGKRKQFMFKTGDGAPVGWHTARLLRFRTPDPGETVCVDFEVTWNLDGMTLHLDVLMTDPVLDDFGFDPMPFVVTRDD